ncbi:MAG: disulfide bond formation protein B [Ardenticatenaceae bacterium]|nr:disulfide bond formation protein B [Ardenticatenaceae bacterium]
MNKRKVWIFLQDYGGILALIVAITATLGSLYFSEVAGFVPCTLCWYQRILMYPLTLVTLVGIIRQDEALPFYVLPFSLIGMGVSGYHVLIQNGVFSHPATCTVGVPCSLRYVNYLGFITIPVLALTAFTLITAVMIATHRAFSHEFWDEGNDAEDMTKRHTSSESQAKLYKWGRISGIVLLLIVLAALIAFRDDEPAENISSTAAPAGLAAGKVLFQEITLGDAPGCVACHSLEPETVIVGPSMANIASQAAVRVPGQSAEAYLQQAIVNPDAHVVDGFTAGVMYQNYEEALTKEQINALVAFLLTLE